MMQSTVSVIQGDWAQSGSMAKQVIRGMGDLLWSDPVGRFAWNAVAREAALSERWDETADDVRDAELALRRDPERSLAFEGTRAVGHALAGRPVEALRAVAGVRRVASVTNLSVLRGELAIAEAIAHRELGDRSRAVTELRVLADTRAETMIYCRVLASLELVQAELDAGNVEEARSAFDRASALIESESMRAGARDWLARGGVLLALASGEVDGGLQWAARLDDPFWRGVSHARLHLATANHGNAVAALDTATARCDRHEVILGLLRARAVDDHDESVKHATAAIEVATANGMLQTVASEGPEALELIERAAWRAPPPWLDRLRRLATSPVEQPRADQSGLVERLTDREREVLRLLPSRLTVKEIADELYVSVNTLKFHLKVIYRKLGVSSRAEAAAKARDLMA
jgi:LuxR family maltose regulon positive regulatory protein